MGRHDHLVRLWRSSSSRCKRRSTVWAACSRTSSSTSACSSPSTTASRESRAPGHSERCCSRAPPGSSLPVCYRCLEVSTSSLIGYALIVPSSLPLGQSPDWGTSLPIIITVLLGIPLVILAAMTARSDFFHEKTVSYVLHEWAAGRFASRGATMELAGAAAAAALSTPGATADPAADAAAQSRSSNE